MKQIAVILLSIMVLLSCSSCEDPTNVDFDKIIENRPIIVDETTPVIYTFSFQTNGGTKVEPIETNTLNFPPNTRKEGYHFVGWFLDSALTQEASFPMTLSENIVLYAKWEVKKYTVTFQSNGGTKINNVTTDILQTPSDITRNDYAFQGWYTNASLTSKAVFPMTLNKDITLYAKWLRTKISRIANDQKIKNGSGYTTEKKIDITPQDFDLEELASQGYYMTITISFDVKYVKDYDALWDIGYFGAPEYEIYLYRNNEITKKEEKIKATTGSLHKTITYTERVADLKNEKFYFVVSTDNLQNVVHFENITITYQCTK